MTKTEKEQIKVQLSAYCERMGSQNKAANSLKEVSSATISKILNEDWELINDRMWRHIGSQIGLDKKTWITVDTRDYKLMTGILGDTQVNSLVLAVKGDAGTGKSMAIKLYAEQNKAVYVLACNEFWNRKQFLQELLASMGKDNAGATVGEMMSDVVLGLKKTEMPLVVMDEADKLSDQVLYFFITLYNQLEDHCGIVLCATDHLEKRIKRGVRLNKKGYKEIFSRIGRKCVPLMGADEVDVAAVCIANGVTEKRDIKMVYEDCEGDLRRVKRKVHAIKQQRG